MIKKLIPRVNFFLGGLFLIGLIYLILPGASTINDFYPLPGSTKSDLTGDTIQNPNIAAYFSNYNRDFITQYYKQIFSKKLIPFISLPFIILNHPPEEAYRYIRDQQESTFLEEYVLPFRESFFVNGYEPGIENLMHGNESDFIGNHLHYLDGYYSAKATIRFYPSNIFVRVAIYILVWIFGIWLWRLFKKTIKQND